MIYVDGNAQFRRLALDLSNGALVVTGNLTLKDNTGSNGTTSNLYVSSTAAREYPYYKSDGSGFPSTAWPCRLQTGTTCTLSQATGGTPVYFRGFLYVKGNLVVESGPAWIISGGLQVDGQLTVQTGGNLVVYYDDNVINSALTTPFQLQIESSRDVSAS